MSLTIPILILVAVVGIAFLIAVAAAFLSGDLRGFFARFLAPDAPKDDSKTGSDQPRYRTRRALLTDGERAFFPVLESVLPDLAAHSGRPALRINYKPRLADLIEPDCRGGRGTPYMSWLGSIKSKHTDAVLIDAESYAPLCVIELDDKSHATARARKSDAVKDAALASAGLPIVRFKARHAYNPREIATPLAEALKTPRT